MTSLRYVTGLLVLVSLLLGAQAAQGAPRDLGPFPGHTLLSDGRAVLAVIGGEQVRTLDVTTDDSPLLSARKGCTLDGLSAGRLLESCPTYGDGQIYATGAALDVRTGARAELPALTVAAFGVSGQSGFTERYVALGRRWAAVQQDDYHSRGTRYLDLTTGAVSPGPGGDRHLVADLDRPAGVRALCRGLRRPRVPNPVFLGLVAGDLAQAGRTAAATSYTEDAAGEQAARVELQRCGHPLRVLRRCVRVRCSQPVLDDRTVAWVERRGEDGISTVVVRALRTGRTRRLHYTGEAQVQLLRHRLYVLAGGRLSSRQP